MLRHDSGTGTTLICSKHLGINSYGVEAHSFVHWVASIKLFWEYDFTTLRQTTERLLAQASKFVHTQDKAPDIGGVFPELVYKCYHAQEKPLPMLSWLLSKAIWLLIIAITCCWSRAERRGINSATRVARAIDAD